MARTSSQPALSSGLRRRMARGPCVGLARSACGVAVDVALYQPVPADQQATRNKPTLGVADRLKPLSW